MRWWAASVPVVVVLGLAVGLASADDHKDKDKAKDQLKPNQVLVKVPGMH